MADEKKNSVPEASKHDAEATETLTEVRQARTPLAFHMAMAIAACFCWIFSGMLFAYIAVPIVIFSLLALGIAVRFHKKWAYRYGLTFVLYLAIAPFFLAGVSFTLSNLFSFTTKYSIGFDIQTPRGVMTVVNNVTIEDRTKLVAPLKAFYSGGTFVKAKSSVVQISEDKSIITLLSPNNNYGTIAFLRNIPRRIKSSKMLTTTEEGVKKYILPRPPRMIYFSKDISPKAFKLLDITSFDEVLGDGYSFLRAWVAFEEIKHSNLVSENVPWWDYEKTAPKTGFFPYGTLGIEPEDFGVHQSTPASFFRF